MSGKIEAKSAMVYRKPGASMGLPERDEYKLLRTDSHQVKSAVELLKKLFP